MFLFDWNEQKNHRSRQERGVTIEEIVYHITHGGFLDTIEHPNQKAYSGQRIALSNPYLKHPAQVH